MGLDITAVKHAEFVHIFDSEDHDDDACPDEYIEVYSQDKFVERLDGLLQGCYKEPEDEADMMYFRAGSYHGYGDWRRILSLLVFGVEPETVWKDRQTYVGQPFYELVDMADNEGAIGPQTSKKLAADFEQLRPTAREGLETLGLRHFVVRDYGVGHWLEKFEQWQKAFKLASDGGLVVFH